VCACVRARVCIRLSVGVYVTFSSLHIVPNFLHLYLKRIHDFNGSCLLKFYCMLDRFKSIVHNIRRDRVDT